jgi:hypothetical protein
MAAANLGRDVDSCRDEILEFEEEEEVDMRGIERRGADVAVDLVIAGIDRERRRLEAIVVELSVMLLTSVSLVNSVLWMEFESPGSSLLLGLGVLARLMLGANFGVLAVGLGYHWLANCGYSGVASSGGGAYSLSDNLDLGSQASAIS